MPVLSLSKSRTSKAEAKQSGSSSSSSPGSSSSNTSPLAGATKDVSKDLAGKITNLTLSRTGSRSGSATPTDKAEKDQKEFEALEAQYGGVFRRANHIGSVVDDWPMYSSQPEDYILGDIVGFGASSVVYQAAFQPLNGRACAVKVIDLEAFGRDTEELRRETQLMSLSKHPNVLRVRGCWVVGHKLHIATRLMSSGSMLDIMRFSHIDGFPEDVICAVLKQALQGLAYLHVNGWLHRDLKAGNVLVDEDGTVLLGDFGVGVWVGEGRDLGKRKSFVGTPCWMAPEVVERKHYNAKADIWSFGITALELAQGHAPHSRLPPVKVLMKTLNEEPPTLDRTGGRFQYSKIFQDFVRVCLQKDPEKRPSAERLLKHAFFKNAKPPRYLVNAILSDLPPLADRQAKQRAMSIASTRYQQSWDFGASPTNSMRILPSANNGGGSSGINGIFNVGGKTSPTTSMSPSGSGFLGRSNPQDPFAGFSGAFAASSPGPSPWNSLRAKTTATPGQSSRGSIFGSHGRAQSGASFQALGAHAENELVPKRSPVSPDRQHGASMRSSIVSLDGEHAIAVEDTDEGQGEQVDRMDDGSSGNGGSSGMNTQPTSTVPSTVHSANTEAAVDEEKLQHDQVKTSEQSKQANDASPALKIAMVSDFFHPNVGGVEGHIYAISKALIKRGHKIIILTHAYPPHRVGVRHITPGIRVYYLPLKVIASQDTLPNFFTSHPLMRFIFIREGINLVHTHQALSSLAHEALFHARWLGLRTVFTDHSLFSLDQDVASILTNKLLAFVLTDVDAVVTVSYAGKENTCQRGGLSHCPEKVWVIPNAVDTDEFQPLPSRPSSDRLTIVILSRLMYRKGIDLLVETIPRICQLYPEVDFLIGGDGPKRVDLEEMRERNLLFDRVNLVGAVSQGDVQQHLTRGSIFLSPSLTEAFGTSLIEAASCGLLIVATQVGGIPEVLPLDTLMLLCEPSSTALIHTTCKAIEQIKNRQHDPEKSHQDVKKMYNWDHVVQRLEVVYDNINQLNRDDSLMDRLIKYHDHNGIIAGKVFCIVVMVDFAFWYMLSWIWPKDNIDVVDDCDRKE
ncbi:unnamed protein product [Sympodiomycopsis kandeliae]